MTAPAHKPTGAERRRSERVFLQVAIYVQGVTPDGHAFREKTKTLAVNAHGGLIHLAVDVRAGDTVTVTVLRGQRQLNFKLTLGEAAEANL